MNRFFLLAGMGALAVSAAFWTYQQQQTTYNPDFGKTIPEIQEDLNQIRLIQIGGEKKNVRIYRDQDNIWKVQQMENYPADIGKVRGFLYKLEQSKRIEQKTSDKERFQKLGLGESTLAIPVTLMKFENEYKPIASFAIGRHEPALKGTFFHRADQSQSWLVSENLRIEDKPLSWTDAEILHLPRSRVRRVEIVRASGEKLTFERDEIGVDFTLKPIPKGRKMKAQYDVNLTSSAFEKLAMIDVVRASELFGKSTLLVTVQTFEGLQLYIDFTEETKNPGQHWAKLFAEYNPDIVLPPTLAEDATEEEKAKHAQQLKASKEEVEKEIARINEDTSGWLYKIASHHFNLLSKKLEEFLLEKEK